jgi:Ca2+-transporting ATPase
MMSNEKPVLPAYRLETKEVLAEFDTVESGLSPALASERLKQYGSNQLHELRKESLISRYLKQFKDRMIILLVASGLIAFYLKDFRTGIVLIVIVLFNTLIGFTQEYKAERIMESLEKLVVPEAKVVRSGKLIQIPSTDLVPGDIVYIEEGDSVPADLRVLEESELASNDFSLTGESSPSRKFTHALASEVELGDRHNLVFMGTTIATGHAHGIVIGTGMQTELGRIANLSQDTNSDLSPLQKELNHIAARVTQGTIVLCAVLLPIAIKTGLGYRDAFLFAIGIASSIIPQGLPAEINTTLAQAAKKLAKARALIKKLSAVETLGATSIICTDKTGTLTKNEMTVQHLLIGKTIYDVNGTGYAPEGTISTSKGMILNEQHKKELELFFAAGAFASNARVNEPDEDHVDWYTVGDPTEGALITLARKAGLEPIELDSSYPELKEFAFDSVRKRMSSIRAYGDGKQIYIFAKGAPESILECSTKVWNHGVVGKLTAETRKFLLARNEELAKEAMRNLAYAYKILPAKTNLDKLTMLEAESDLTLLGMVSMIDPLRDEVKAAMEDAHKAHIKVSIVTGDYATTARAIAARAGLADKNGNMVLVTGLEVRSMDDSYILKLVKAGSVIFSRVSPEDKLRIVGLVKDSGQVVAVTGDGIHDAPALKRADIGVAMGRTGTDVAKQSADIVLLDDSFHTLVSAIQQGRVVFQNIRKATLSCFTSNAAELVVNLVSLAAFAVFHVPLALSVMEILAIDLIAELFPIAALGWDQADGELMNEYPRDPHDHILNLPAIGDLLWCGILIGGLAFINFMLFFARAHINPQGLAPWSLVHMKATALTYLTIVLCQLGNILQRRSRYGLFTRYQLHNKQLWLAMAFSLFCVANIIYNPWIAPYFRASSIAWIDWWYAIAAAAIFLGIREFQRYSKQHSRKAVVHLHHQLSSDK